MASQKQKRITAQDLYRFNFISDCQVSPDGKHIVFPVSRIDRAKQKSYSSLWIVPTGTGNARQFTCGDQADRMPRWSPDGSKIAFVSNRRDEKQSQIFIIPFLGGEACPLTKFKGEIGNIQWSPDNRHLLCLFRKKDKETIEREKDEKKKKLGIVSRHIKRVFFKLDGYGFLPKERWHLWVVNASSGKARQLTKSPIFDEETPVWSPDSREIAFISNRSKEPDLNPDALDLFIASAKTGRIRKINTPKGPITAPSYSPDGKTIAYVGHEGFGDWWKNDHLWIVPANNKGRAKNLTRKYDIQISNWTISDSGDLPEFKPPVWSNDGKRIYFQIVKHGSTEIISLAMDTGRLHSVIGDKGSASTFCFDRKQSVMAYMMGTLKDPCQIHSMDVKTGKTKMLTRLNQPWLGALDFGRMEEVWYKGASGNQLQGWILKPPGFRPSRKYPSILEIHGGPLLQYGNLFMHEFYFLAANGYVVYFTNPRGGTGYGEKHARAAWNRWGTCDYNDLMKWADYVARKPYIDKDRMGVTGGSYGGYMTNWIISHTSRFKAAVTQRCVSNFTSMWGSSDFNWIFQEELGSKPPWENIRQYWRMSPMKYMGNVKTPTLVIHSEQDHRCAIEQGEQVFVALKKQGVDTEMVRFPDEPHGLSRQGRTDRRIERLNHILRWFDKYLK